MLFLNLIGSAVQLRGRLSVLAKGESSVLFDYWVKTGFVSSVQEFLIAYPDNRESEFNLDNQHPLAKSFSRFPFQKLAASRIPHACLNTKLFIANWDHYQKIQKRKFYKLLSNLSQSEEI